MKGKGMGKIRDVREGDGRGRYVHLSCYLKEEDCN